MMIVDRENNLDVLTVMVEVDENIFQMRSVSWMN